MVLWINRSDNINLYGLGGNAAAFAAAEGYPAGYATYTPSLIRVTDSSNFRIVNTVDYGRASGNDPVFGKGVDPNLWHAIVERQNGIETRSNVRDRPVLYMRTSP